MRDTKHLEKHSSKLAESKKEKSLFRNQRKAVEAGAHGTLEYTIKEGPNKDKLADDSIIKNKKNNLTTIIHVKFNRMRRMFKIMNFFKF